MVAAVVVLWAAAAGAAERVPEPSGFRMENYRAPVPDRLTGARVVDTDEAHALWREGRAIFVDVLPRARKPENLPDGTYWRETPRQDIPGSIWLPDTGHGALAPEMQAYFEQGLAQATGGDRDRPLLFYCLADCWMSWNAARRAQEAGYRHVLWYPEGTDGWASKGLPLEDQNPEPRPGEAPRQ